MHAEKRLKQPHLFEGARLSLDESYQMTVDSLRAYGELSPYWFVSYSGGKDSTATLTVIARIIAEGKVKPPKKLFAYYVDTRLEFPPLQIAALSILKTAQANGIDTRVIYPPMDKRLMVNILGRGVPPPSNIFRWCTEATKVNPMMAAQRELYEQHQSPFLSITGVRLGESAMRDQRIAYSCTRDGGECGQGWFQHASGEQIAHTLAPLLHWRLCHVWDWLMFFAPEDGYDTQPIAEAYGIDEEGSAAEVNARTGCIGCNLVDEDAALLNLLRFDRWKYLAPLIEIKQIWRWLALPENRLRHTNRIRKDGSPAARDGKLGAITLEARAVAFERVLDIQMAVNSKAAEQGRPGMQLISPNENVRIRELIKSKAYPMGWSGDEPRGDVLIHIERLRAEQGRTLFGAL